jgi:peroxiredoxin
MSRRSKFTVWSALVLLVAYFGITSWIRAYVDGLIHHAVGKPLPEFALVDRGGRTWTNADLRGKRALLHFFRSHCHSCDIEAEAVRELEQRLPGDAVLLHVMTDAVLGFPPDLTAATLAGKRFTAPVLMADSKLVDAFHRVKWSNVTPITYVVDAQGAVRYGLRGAQKLAAFEQALAASR